MKRLICLILSIAMVLSLLPVSALAEGEEVHDEVSVCEEEHSHEEEKPAPKEEKKEEKKAEPEPEPVKEEKTVEPIQEEKAEEPAEEKQEEKPDEPVPVEEKQQEDQPEKTEPEEEAEPVEEEPAEEPAEEDHSEPATEKTEPLYPWSELDDDDLIAYIFASQNEKYLKELLLNAKSDEYAAFLARIESIADKDAREEVSAYLLTLIPAEETAASEEPAEIEPMIPDTGETGEGSASNETDESTDEVKDEPNLTEESALFEETAEVPEPDAEKTAETLLPGDVNGDSRVNGLDLLWLTRYAAGAAAEIKPENADVNVDGIVDDIDIERLTKILTGAV